MKFYAIVIIASIAISSIETYMGRPWWGVAWACIAILYWCLIVRNKR